MYTNSKPVGVFRVVVAPNGRFRYCKGIDLARFGRVKPTVLCVKMFDSKLDILNGGRTHKFCIFHDAEPLRYADVIHLWQDNEAFRSFFISTLSDVPFSAYRWETPAVTTDTINRAFEFAILNTPALARTPDPIPFARHFAAADSKADIVVFENLGKDATLVVPSPRGPAPSYGHLAAFTRQASASQNHALWRTVGETMQRQITERPLWLSTAGGGVSWLHVRLDSWPKYYGFRLYKEFA